MPNLNDLALYMETLSDKVDSASSQLAVEVAITIISELAYKTPVDTSKALSSWFVTLGSPSTNVGKAYFVGEEGSTRNSSAAETIKNAKNILATKKAGQVIYLTNNQPYIKRLNEGYSKQQAAGFVERAIMVGQVKAKNIKIELK